MVDQISNRWRYREPRASKFYSGLVNKDEADDGYFKKPLGTIKYIKTTDPEVGYQYLNKMTLYKIKLDKVITDKANIRDKAIDDNNGDEILLLDKELAELNERKISKLRLFFVKFIAIGHSGLVKFCKIALPLSSTSMHENMHKLALQYILLPITGLPLLISLSIISFAGWIHRVYAKRTQDRAPVGTKTPQEIKEKNLDAAKYNRIGYSVINLAITAGIILGLVNPILLIPVVVVGVAIAAGFFGAAHKNSIEKYQPLSQYEINEIRQDDSKIAKKAIGAIMKITLVLAITNIIAFVLAIPILSNPWIFLVILIARPFLESAMHYLNNKDLDNQIDYIDSKLIERCAEYKIKKLKNLENLISDYKEYRQFLIDQQKTPASWNTFLEFGFGVRVVIMSFFSIAGFALFPASPFIALGFAFIFILVSVINRIYVSTKMSKPTELVDELVEFNKLNKNEYNLETLLEAVDRVYATDRKYSIVIKTIKASMVLLASYAFLINISAVGAWLGISIMSAFPVALLITAIVFAVLGILTCILLERLKIKKIDEIKKEINPDSKKASPAIFKEEQLSCIKAQGFNRAWGLTALPIIVFAIGLIIDISFFATPVGITLLALAGAFMIIGNIINAILSSKKHETESNKVEFTLQGQEPDIIPNDNDNDVKTLKKMQESLEVTLKRNPAPQFQAHYYRQFLQKALNIPSIKKALGEINDINDLESSPAKVIKDLMIFHQDITCDSAAIFKKTALAEYNEQKRLSYR